MSTTIEKIQRQIVENPILLLHERFTETAELRFTCPGGSQALAACGERFAYVDILRILVRNCRRCVTGRPPATVG